MYLKHLVLAFGAFAIATAQSSSEAIVVNLDTANWTRETGAPPDSEGAVLHTDPTGGGMDLLVRFPASHVIPPHWHESNERVFVAEGQLTLRQDAGNKVVKSGGLRLSAGAGNSAPFLQLPDTLHVLSFLGRQTSVACREVTAQRSALNFAREPVLGFRQPSPRLRIAARRRCPAYRVSRGLPFKLRRSI